MIPIKSERDLRVMRKSCEIAATVLDKISKLAVAGVSTWDLNEAAKRLMDQYHCRSAAYKYKCGSLKYPCHVCISVNDQVIHGIASKDVILKDSDIVSIDCATIYQGFVGDNTRTVYIEEPTPEVRKLVEATAESLRLGIDKARPGNRVGDISAAIQKYVESLGFGVVREFTGHGVGRNMHEEPEVPNYGRAGTGPLLRPGMTLAIEPMITMGNPEIFVGDDGWTVYTADGKPSCHIEHTVLVTESDPEILTLPASE